MGQRQVWFDAHNVENHPLYVAEQNGVVAGYASLSAYREKEAFASTVELSIYVAPECRRQGVATALMKFILQKAREDGEALVRKTEADARREASKIAERSDAEIFARRDAAQKEEAARKDEAMKSGESRLDSAADFLITRLKKEKNAP